MTNEQRIEIEIEDKRLDQEEQAWSLYIRQFYDEKNNRIPEEHHATIIKLIVDDKTLDLLDVDDTECLLDRTIEHLEEYGGDL